MIKQTEMTKLATLLAKEDIPFEIVVWAIGEEPCLMIASPDADHRVVDAVCHQYSYGGKEGLIEVLGSANPNLPNSDIKGWMTANEAFQYFTEM